MAICYFGDYSPEYPRNRVIKKGLEDNGFLVMECVSGLKGFRKYFDLFKEYQKIKNKCNLIIVGYSENRLMPLFAKLIAGKKVFWDAFYSIYDSKVFDRKKTPPNSLKACYYWASDWISCVFSDKILLDTNEHIKYFVNTFKTDKDKFIRVFVGTDSGVFYPLPAERKEKEFTAHFHGTYIPLHGARYIVEAAKLLEDEAIKFRFIGSEGQTRKGVLDLAAKLKIKNIDFIKTVAYEELPEYIADADVCLGIFGDSKKALRVIPNKLYEAAAMKKPIITADSAAVRELFTDRKNILFCRPADPADLAAKIMELKENDELRIKIANKGYVVFQQYALPQHIVKPIINEVI